MKDEAIAPYAPIRVSVEFALTDGNQVAQASFDCPIGQLPTQDNIAKAAASVLAQVREQLGETFFFQNRHAFVSDEMADRTGGFRLAIPGPDTWQAPWAEGQDATTPDTGRK